MWHTLIHVCSNHVCSVDLNKRTTGGRVLFNDGRLAVLLMIDDQVSCFGAVPPTVRLVPQRNLLVM